MSWEQSPPLRQDPDLEIFLRGSGNFFTVWHGELCVFKSMNGRRYADAYYDGLKAGLLHQQAVDAERERLGKVLGHTAQRRLLMKNFERNLVSHKLVLVRTRGGTVTHLINEGLGDTVRCFCGKTPRENWVPCGRNAYRPSCMACYNQYLDLIEQDAKENSPPA